MRTRTKAAIGLLSTIGLVFSSGVAAHDSDTEGHVPKNVNYGFDVIGRDTLGGVQDGLYTDVWSHEGYAYIGTFQNPGCTDAGVFIVDIAQAVDQYSTTGAIEGATVAEIKSAPNTRINDVKVVEIGDQDVLIATQEQCGASIPGFFPSDGQMSFSLGQGGISLYDVTNPTKPKNLKKNWLSRYDGVHNTFAWTTPEGTFLIGVGSEDFWNDQFTDTFIADISKPQSPKLLVETGILDWLPAGALADGQFETGAFESISLHDVWVEQVMVDDELQWQALLPYWDAGYIVLNVDDPSNPEFLGDSTFPEYDPPTRDAGGQLAEQGPAYEGNAHAGVFGGDDGEYLFVGDEDFDPAFLETVVNGEPTETNSANFGGDPGSINGVLIDTGDLGCAIGDIDPAPVSSDAQIAVIDRGTCDFSSKSYNAQTQGYDGVVIVNNIPGDGAMGMGAGADAGLVTIPVVSFSFEKGAELRAAAGVSNVLGTIAVDTVFDGWGYFRVLNNTNADVTVPDEGINSESTMTAEYLGQLGYYAPAETLEEGFYAPNDPIGDLSMHNVEVDPTTQDIVPSYDEGPRMFVSWYALGLRALEYRPGHYHTNANDEGSYSQNVHEVGRFIADDGSNFWGVHVDTIEVVDDVTGESSDSQIILASDRNTGLWIFTFGCESQGEVEGPFYCTNGTDPNGN